MIQEVFTYASQPGGANPETQAAFWHQVLDWRWVMILAPAMIIINYMAYLVYERRRQFPENVQFMDNLSASLRTQLVQTTQDARASWNAEFYLSRILNSLGVPLLFVTFACMWAMHSAVREPLLFSADSTNKEILVAAQVNATFGAYLYILLLLGKRALARDIRRGIVNWCAVSMIVGPILGNVASRFFDFSKIKENQAAFVSVTFVAGFAPRTILSAIGDVAERFLVKTGKTASASARVIPLSQIRGITPEIEERLAESGIYDIHTLAYADPLALMSSTPFKRRQIIHWMDEALLQIVCPDSWQSLERAGITGAIDLAYCNYQNGAIARLAEITNQKAVALEAVSARLAEDRQCLIIWALYQSDSTAADNAPWMLQAALNAANHNNPDAGRSDPNAAGKTDNSGEKQ